MLQLSDNAKNIYDLVFTREFSLELLKNELASGEYTADDISAAGYRYVYDCCFLDFNDGRQKPRRKRGTLLQGYCSSHMLEALKCLLDYGLDPNALYGEPGEQGNIMSELRYVENGYLAADSLALLLDHGGNPSIKINGVALVRDVNMDFDFGLNEQIDRTSYDALVHYWMVLVGYGAKLEDGRESIDMCPGHDVSELKKHRDFYYGAIHSHGVDYHMEICIFSKHTNWEIGRY